MARLEGLEPQPSDSYKITVPVPGELIGAVQATIEPVVDAV